MTIKLVAESSSSGNTTKGLLHTMLGRTRRLLIAGLLAVLVLFLALAWATRDALTELPFLRKQRAEAGRRGKPLVRSPGSRAPRKRRNSP